MNASNIRSVSYDAPSQVLEIEFSNGSIYQYSGVSPEVHRRFINSPSTLRPRLGGETFTARADLGRRLKAACRRSLPGFAGG